MSLAWGMVCAFMLICTSLWAVELPQDSVPVKDDYASYALRVEEINGMKEGLSKSRMLGEMLDELANKEKELEQKIISQIDLNTFSKRDVLVIDAQSTRRMMRDFSNQDLDSCATLYRHNPYALFNVGVMAFQYSRDDQTYGYFKSAIEDFIELRDTAYLLSAYNNLAAYFWQSNELDSAVLYFSLAKKTASWHPLMIDVNLLNLAVLLEDTVLASAEISFLRDRVGQMWPIERQFYTRNAFSYYKTTKKEAHCDSILQYVLSEHGSIDSLPNTYLAIPIFQEQYLSQVSIAFWGVYIGKQEASGGILCYIDGELVYLHQGC